LVGAIYRDQAQLSFFLGRTDLIFRQSPDVGNKAGPFVEQLKFVHQVGLGEWFLVRDDEDHGEIAPQHGTTGILDVATEAVEDLRSIGNNAGAVFADDGHGEVDQIVFATVAHRVSLLAGWLRKKLLRYAHPSSLQRSSATPNSSGFASELFANPSGLIKFY
jgi:hypothetical protein